MALLFLRYYLQNMTYPAARHAQNSSTLNIDVEGIRRMTSIPVPALSKANPTIRFTAYLWEDVYKRQVVGLVSMPSSVLRVSLLALPAITLILSAPS